MKKSLANNLRETSAALWFNALRPKEASRVKSAEQAKGQAPVVVAARSVRELNGLFQGKRSKPVSIKEMSLAIARRASRSR